MSGCLDKSQVVGRSANHLESTVVFSRIIHTQVWIVRSAQNPRIYSPQGARPTTFRTVWNQKAPSPRFPLYYYYCYYYYSITNYVIPVYEYVEFMFLVIISWKTKLWHMSFLEPVGADYYSS
jgi:hypothetical protein